MRTTREQRDELRRLSDQAKAGPWEANPALCCADLGWVDPVVYQSGAGKLTHSMDIADAELIAAMRNAIDGLLDDLANAWLEGVLAERKRIVKWLDAKATEYRTEQYPIGGDYSDAFQLVADQIYDREHLRDAEPEGAERFALYPDDKGRIVPTLVDASEPPPGAKCMVLPKRKEASEEKSGVTTSESNTNEAKKGHDY